MSEKNIRDIALEKLSQGDYAAGFEVIYAHTQKTNNNPPWAHMMATPDFVAWAERESLSGVGKRALVIACGMGDDAHYLTELGFDVVAFDVSESAIEICKRRFPDSTVKFTTADLFNTPEDWHQAYDFVLENRTIQALPQKWYEKTIGAIANLVAPQGQLLLLCHGRNADEEAHGRIPWPVSHDELQAFIEQGLTEIQFEDIQPSAYRRFRVLYRRD
jgi:SAM-dependent methyltransferase